MSWELTGVPYTSAARAGGIADGIAVLRSAGLSDRLRRLGVSDGGDLEVPSPSGVRGPSGLLNEDALGQLVETTAERIGRSRRQERRALLVGGDCPVLLGALAAIGNPAQRAGLVMIDGHEDAWPPDRSETGEASDSELALALGLVSASLPPALGRRVPLVDAGNVAMLGPRDSAEIRTAGVASIRDRVRFFVDAQAIDRHGPGRAMSKALQAIESPLFWLHIDLDALSSQALAAVDYPQPGGLDWDQLDVLAATAARDLRCCGMSVVIYNPDLDPQHIEANKVVDFISRVIEQCSLATPKP